MPIILYLDTNLVYMSGRKRRHEHPLYLKMYTHFNLTNYMAFIWRSFCTRILIICAR